MLLSVEDKRNLAREIDRLLCEEYGTPANRAEEDPIDVLVATILSQNTSNANSHRAFDGLKERFPDWESAEAAPAEEIERTIRAGGLARVKSRRIKEILSRIRAEYGDLSLEALRKMNPPQALEALRKYEGVGSKTAHCVLLFAFEMNVFPVDTHILRISKRIGLVPDSASLEFAHDLWAQFLPDESAYSLHLTLITHGRQTCRPKKPRCLDCCLGSVCRSRVLFLQSDQPVAGAGGEG